MELPPQLTVDPRQLLVKPAVQSTISTRSGGTRTGAEETDGGAARTRMHVKQKRIEKAKPVYCICRTSDEDELMIQCDACEEWFHTRCVGVRDEDASAMDEYYCPNCEEASGRNGGGTKPAPAALTSHANDVYLQLCSRPSCMKAATDGSAYCSQDCEVKAAAANSDSDSSTGRKRLRHASSSLAKKRKVISSITSKPGGGMTTQAKDGGPSRKSLATQRPGSSESATLDPLRNVILDKFTKILSELHVNLSKPDASAPGESAGDPPTQKLRELAVDLEAELFFIYSAFDPRVNRTVPNEIYKQRFRTLEHRLKDPGNQQLSRRLLTGKITPFELANMSDVELMSDESRQRLEEAKAKALESVVKHAEEMDSSTYVRKTHKGEETVGGERLSVDTTVHDIRLMETDSLDSSTSRAPSAVDVGTPARKGSVAESESGATTPQGSALDKFLLSFLSPTDASTTSVATRYEERAPAGFELPADIDAIISNGTGAAEPLAREELLSPSAPFSSGYESVSAESARSTTPPPPSEPEAPWMGQINFPDVGKFSCHAQQIGGLPYFPTSNEWSDILPGVLQIGGRMSPKTGEDYVKALKGSTSKHLLVIKLVPGDILADGFDVEANGNTFMEFWEYFLGRDRWAVVSYNYVTVKDMYIAPVAAGDPAPECVREATWSDDATSFGKTPVPDGSWRAPEDMLLGFVIYQEPGSLKVGGGGSKRSAPANTVAASKHTKVAKATHSPRPVQAAIAKGPYMPAGLVNPVLVALPTALPTPKTHVMDWGTGQVDYRGNGGQPGGSGSHTMNDYPSWRR